MSDPIVLNGRKHQWTLKEFLGKGYSGEVYRVVSYQYSDNREGVLKRPDVSNVINPLPDQAKQIEQERKILDILHLQKSTSGDFAVQVCDVLDRSKRGSEEPRNFFVVTAKASGKTIIDLADEYESNNFAFPRLTLLRVLYGLYLQIKTAHKSNIIWNDVKPEHLFWDSENHLLTIIDWANGEFVEANGITKDLKFSVDEDYFLFVERLANFVNEHDPNLSSMLGWPDPKNWGREITVAQDLIEKIRIFLSEETNKFKALLDREAQIIRQSATDLEQLQHLVVLQDQFAAFGEKPDRSNLERFAKRLANHLILMKDFAELEKTALFMIQTHELEQEKWILLRDINRVLVSESDSFSENSVFEILTDALEDAWELVLWKLFEVKSKLPATEHFWWDKLSRDVRKKTIAGKFAYPLDSVQALVELLAKKQHEINHADPLMSTVIKDLEKIIDELNGYIYMWKEVQVPKGCGIQYPFLYILDSLRDKYSKTTDPIKQAIETIDLCISQPRQHIVNLLQDWESWGEKDYNSLRQKLPIILAWDPDLARLFKADIALKKAINWRARLTSKPDSTEYHALISVGEELKTALSDTEWLKDIVEALVLLSNKNKVREIVSNNPTVITYLSWLKDIDDSDPPLPVPLPDSELLALDLFYDCLKVGKFDQAIAHIQHNTREKFFVPYINAVKKIKSILRLLPTEQGRLTFSINDLSQKDDEKTHLRELIRALQDWVEKRNTLRSVGAAIQDFPQSIVDWPITQSLVIRSKIFIETNNKFLSRLENILDAKNNITTRKEINLRRSLEDILDKLEKENKNWNDEINKSISSGSSLDLDIVIVNLLKESEDVKDYFKRLEESTQKFQFLIKRLDLYQKSKDYSQQQWDSAENLLTDIIKLDCPGIPPLDVRQNWQRQYNKIRFDVLSRAEDIKNLDRNHPLYEWLRNVPLPQPVLRPEPIPGPGPKPKPILRPEPIPGPGPGPKPWPNPVLFLGWIVVCILLITGIFILLIKKDDVSCWLNPSNPSCELFVPTKSPNNNKHKTPTKEHPTAIPSVTVVATSFIQPENLETKSTPLPDSVKNLPSEECQIYLQYFNDRKWDLYLDSISRLNNEQYEKLANKCLWSYTKGQKEKDIELYQAIDSVFLGDMDTARGKVESIIKIPVENLTSKELFLLIQRTRIINSMCNLSKEKIASVKTIKEFINYSSWLIRTDKFYEHVFYEVCGEYYAYFQSTIIDAAIEQSEIVSFDYLRSGLLATSNLPDECNFITQTPVNVFILDPQFKNCLQYGQFSSDNQLLGDQVKNRFITLEVNYCFSPALLSSDEYFGIVVSQNRIPGGDAFILSLSQPPIAYLYSYTNGSELDLTDIQTDGNHIDLGSTSIKFCQPVTIQLNKVGNIIFLGNKQGIPQLQPIIIPDEYRMSPIRFGLIVPAFDGMEIQIDSINISFGELP